jgi:GH15 family glucan-1,4-alpha-glucosidase
VDRGCHLVEQLRLPGDLARWRAQADRLRAEVLAQSVTGGRFARAYGEPALDASLLMLPLVGFLHSDHPLMLATTDAIERDVRPQGAAERGLAPVPLSHQAADGLPGQEGAFAICSFWLVEALAVAGRYDDAEKVSAAWSASAATLACSPSSSTRPPASSSATPHRPPPTSA